MWRRNCRIFAIFKVSCICRSDIFHGSNLFPEPLTPEEEKKYLEQMAKKDDEARNILIERNLRLVAHVAKKYATTNVDQDDLISIGTIRINQRN